MRGATMRGATEGCYNEGCYNTHCHESSEDREHPVNIKTHKHESSEDREHIQKNRDGFFEFLILSQFFLTAVVNVVFWSVLCIENLEEFSMRISYSAFS